MISEMFTKTKYMYIFNNAISSTLTVHSHKNYNNELNEKEKSTVYILR